MTKDEEIAQLRAEVVRIHRMGLRESLELVEMRGEMLRLRAQLADAKDAVVAVVRQRDAAEANDCSRMSDALFCAVARGRGFNIQ